MVDNFADQQVGLASPAEYHYEVEIESGGDTILDPRPRTLVIMSDGDVEIVDKAGTRITYEFEKGAIVPFRGYALGPETTADVVAWY